MVDAVATTSRTRRRAMMTHTWWQRYPTFIWWMTAALMLHLGRSIVHSREGSFPCSKDDECEQRYNTTSSYCIAETGTCSNPFRMGCLYARGGEGRRKKRVCNSDDSKGSKECIVSELDVHLPNPYPEIRIHNADWESSIFMSWIYQVILMEFAEVGATVGLRSEDTISSSFYDVENRGLQFSQDQYPFEALVLGNERMDCSSTNLPCVHVLPEVWRRDASDIDLPIERIIEPVTENGLLGNSGLKIPLVLAKQYPELSVWFGWAGEERGSFLAEMFKRPLTWAEYCEKISRTTCVEVDSTAARAPNSSGEGK